MVITQDELIKQIAEKEDINLATVREVFESAEDIIFDHLSSTSPSDDILIKILNGVTLERRYIQKKKYSKGIFQDINCPAKIKLKASSSKYLAKKVNDELASKNLLN